MELVGNATVSTSFELPYTCNIGLLNKSVVLS